MKNLIILLTVLGIAFASCKELSETSHMEEMTKMKDSIFSVYPSVASITINVRDRKQLLITLGSEKLAKSTDTERRQVADELAAMTLRIFGKDSGIEEEKVIITADEKNTAAEPAGALVSVISIDSLEKATAP